MKSILDVACGGKMFYFDKNDSRVHFNDIRRLETTLCDGRRFVIEPETNYDFTNLPFDDEVFDQIQFDPPHLLKIGEKSWLAIKYGKLSENWKEILSKAFDECFRVLKFGGTLLFKWNETDIKLKEVLALTPVKPISFYGFGKKNKTRLVNFIKCDGANETHSKP